MIYCFDIDGTLCTNTHGEYEKAEPFPEVIARVNALYAEGHRIVLYTARGSATAIDWREVTERQLREWGLQYHELFLGKPNADLYVDDRAQNAADWSTSPGFAGGNGGAQRGESGGILTSASYLDLTYSTVRAPYGDYPSLLGRWLLRNVYRRPGRLLDVGCGRGEHLSAFVALGFDVAGVDISPRAPELAAGFDVKVADLERDALPYPAGTFDFVFSKSVVEHVREPARLLARTVEALRPGGVAAIMTPSWEHTYWGPFYVDHTHVTPFTAPSLADALALAGCVNVRVSYFYQLPFLWRHPWLWPVVRLVAALPLRYRPYHAGARWPDAVNKLIRFSKEVMLLAVGEKPTTGSGRS